MRYTLGLLAISACSGSTLAQPSLDWRVQAGGGGDSSLGAFTLSGTMGQVDCGDTLTLGAYTLTGGFWVGDLTPTCVADVDDGSFTSTPDGGVTVDDLLYFLFIFEQGDLRADVDDGASSGTPDGGVTIDDLLYFLQRFEAGC